MIKNYLVADFAGTKQEAVAWCELHPEFIVVEIANSEHFPGVAYFVGNDEEVPNSVVLKAMNLFNQLGWDNGSLTRLELDEEDEVKNDE
jgi:hypothetical protein